MRQPVLLDTYALPLSPSLPATTQTVKSPAIAVTAAQIRGLLWILTADEQRAIRALEPKAMILLIRYEVKAGLRGNKRDKGAAISRSTEEWAPLWALL